MLHQGSKVRMESASDFVASFQPASLCFPGNLYHHHQPHHLAPESTGAYRPFGQQPNGGSSDLSGLFPPFPTAASNKLSIKSSAINNELVKSSGSKLLGLSSSASSSPTPSPHHFNLGKEVTAAVGVGGAGGILPSAAPWFLQQQQQQPGSNNNKKRRQMSESASGTLGGTTSKSNKWNFL